MDDLEQRLAALEKALAYEKPLRDLREQLEKLEGRSFWQEHWVAVLVGVVSAALTLWANLARMSVDEQLAVEQRQHEKTLEGLKDEHEAVVTQLKLDNESRMSQARELTENRKITFEMVRELTPKLLSGSAEERKRAIDIAGQLDRAFWEPIAAGFKDDPAQKDAINKISKARVARFQGAHVSCDRASHRTTDKLGPSGEAKANEVCRSISVVNVRGTSEPYQWPGGAGLSFDTGTRIGTESVWCSCSYVLS